MYIKIDYDFEELKRQVWSGAVDTMEEIEKAEYYIHEYKKYKIDLETLHRKLYNLFGSYKIAVGWLADNWQ